MTLVGHHDEGFGGIYALFFAHVFAAAISAGLLWAVVPKPLLAILVFVGVAVLLTPPLLPWYRHLHPQPESVDG
jgi:membrane protein implicated in regulation of membrane protease activity